MAPAIPPFTVPCRPSTSSLSVPVARIHPRAVSFLAWQPPRRNGNASSSTPPAHVHPLRQDLRPRRIERAWQATWDREGTNSFTVEEAADRRTPVLQPDDVPIPLCRGAPRGQHLRLHRGRCPRPFPAHAGPRRLRADRVRRLRYPLRELRAQGGGPPDGPDPGQRGQLHPPAEADGGMFDWDHTVDTTAPSTTSGRSGSSCSSSGMGWAEQKEAPVNWCPSDMTVLANEQVVVGACERCGTPVEQRFIRQWFLKITEYAGRLLDNLPGIDWSDTTRKAQRAWIRRSRGAEIRFPVMAEAGGSGERGEPLEISAFTHAAGHGLRGNLHGPRARTPAGRRRHQRSPPRRGGRLPRPHPGHGPGCPAEGREAQDRRVHRGVLHQPGHRASRSPSGSRTTS